MEINALGYLGFTSPNAKSWETFGPQVIGLGLAEPGDDGTVYLRMDDRHHRIAIHPGPADGLAYIGWELKTKAAFLRACDELRAAGYQTYLGTHEECAERKVKEFVRVTDPSGFVHELFYAATFTIGSFQPGKPMRGRFVAGMEGVGHVVMVLPEWTDAMDKFINEVLGLELYCNFLAPLPDGTVSGPQFFRCNQRSHCLAYVVVPGHRGVQHIALEGTSMDDVGRAWDLVQEGDYEITMTLGRHTIDTLISFYMRSPGGFDIEFGAGGLTLDTENFVMEGFSTSEVWGHKFIAKGWSSTVKPVQAGAATGPGE